LWTRLWIFGFHKKAQTYFSSWATVSFSGRNLLPVSQKHDYLSTFTLQNVFLCCSRLRHLAILSLDLTYKNVIHHLFHSVKLLGRVSNLPKEEEGQQRKNVDTISVRSGLRTGENVCAWPTASTATVTSKWNTKVMNLKTNWRKGSGTNRPACRTGCGVSRRVLTPCTLPVRVDWRHGPCHPRRRDN
jgi:hypothetical protein